VSGSGDPAGVVQHLAESRAGAGGDGHSRERMAGRRGGASESQSCLKEVEKQVAERATGVEEEEVVGTCVYYYLPGPGHDAGSRIGITSVFSLEALFRLGASGRGAELDRTSGMQHCV
jgi:hypothetical protein